MNENALHLKRLLSIDIMRGCVILLMLLDHVRETFFLHYQVSDPMDIATTNGVLFISRFLAHLCAPIFVFLTGLSAYLYMQKVNDKNETAQFLVKRGLFLILLEITLVNFAWTFQFPPQKLFLQVIWAIGFSMVALSALIYLPKKVLFCIGVLIVAGHNLLDSIHFAKDSMMSVPWAILHDRGWIELGVDMKARTSYPILPWIGVIALGYVAGSWFDKKISQAVRTKYLVSSGIVLIASFSVMRYINLYGDKPYVNYDTFLETFFSVINITKYPPSLFFILLTLGIGALLIVVFEHYQTSKWLQPLSVFGGAPMFFYLLHLYVLKCLYVIAVGVFGKNNGEYFGFSSMGYIWLFTIVLACVLYPVVKWYGNLKQRRKDIAWLKYL